MITQGWFDFVFSHGAEPSQHRFELFNLMAVLNVHRLRKIVEIGTFKGGTLRFWNEIIDESGIVVSVDKNDRGFIPDVKEQFLNYDNIHFVIGDSGDEKTANEVKFIIKEPDVDLLFIDGCHDYEPVKKDYELYSPLVRKGGFIVFHDIVNEAVAKVWAKVKNLHNGYIELHGQVNPCGIGMVQK